MDLEREQRGRARPRRLAVRRIGGGAQSNGGNLNVPSSPSSPPLLTASAAATDRRTVASTQTTTFRATFGVEMEKPSLPSTHGYTSIWREDVTGSPLAVTSSDGRQKTLFNGLTVHELMPDEDDECLRDMDLGDECRQSNNDNNSSNDGSSGTCIISVEAGEKVTFSIAINTSSKQRLSLQLMCDDSTRLLLPGASGCFVIGVAGDDDDEGYESPTKRQMLDISTTVRTIATALQDKDARRTLYKDEEEEEEVESKRLRLVDRDRDVKQNDDDDEHQMTNENAIVEADKSDDGQPKPIKLIEGYGITSGDIRKLEGAGLCTVESVAYSSRKQLLAMKGISTGKAAKIRAEALKLVDCSFEMARQIMSRN